MSISTKIDRSVLRKIKIDDDQGDFAFWQTKPYEERLATLEAIRQEYIAWAYDSKPGFQRVYTIAKQT